MAQKDNLTKNEYKVIYVI